MKAVAKDRALYVAGLIFMVVAIAHLVRIFTHFNLLIARYLVPIWPSYIGFVVFFLLAVWMFRSARSGDSVKGKVKAKK